MSRRKNKSGKRKKIIYAAGEVETSFDMIACQVVNIINFFTEKNIIYSHAMHIEMLFFFLLVSFKIHNSEEKRDPSNENKNIHTQLALHTPQTFDSRLIRPHHRALHAATWNNTAIVCDNNAQNLIVKEMQHIAPNPRLLWPASDDWHSQHFNSSVSIIMTIVSRYTPCLSSFSCRCECWLCVDSRRRQRLKDHSFSQRLKTTITLSVDSRAALCWRESSEWQCLYTSKFMII